MKIKPYIAELKITGYLLKQKKRNDKSKFLKSLGYKMENWKVLRNDIISQIAPNSAELIEKNKFGEIYQIEGQLLGPNKVPKNIITIWIKKKTSDILSFVTLFPKR